MSRFLMARLKSECTISAMFVSTQNYFVRITQALLLCALPTASVMASPVDVDGLPRLASYTGTYEISLVKAAQLQGVRAASGKMVYTLIDRCDGYTVETDVDINLAFSNGLTNRMLKRYAGWESKDGRRSTFRMQMYENGELEDTYTGTVDLTADGSGRAAYASAESMTFDLPQGTVLSSKQLRDLIRSAQGAVPFFVQSVMDGAFETGPYRTTGYIAPPREKALNVNPEGSGVSSEALELLDGPFWPVTMAYFPMGKATELPEYELSFQLLANGVIRAMTQDYGAYMLSLQLTGISPREGGC
jgi:hypothetical protein